ncbi:MAG: GntR family transcriptional regulator, partial [Bacteroidia bacterium]|nr:GntR family transcriptional regulator [Bacteroidia bacterium]
MAEFKKENLVEQVKGYVVECIRSGKWAPGERIDAVRKLADSLRISHVTVASAIKQLAAEKILEPKGSAGTRVAKLLPFDLGRYSDSKRKWVLYFFFEDNASSASNYHRDILCALQQNTEMRGWRINVGSFSEKAVLEAANKPDTIGIVHSFDIYSFQDLPVPVISYGMLPGLLPCITPNNYRAGFDAGRLCISAAMYSKVYFITVDRKNDSFLNEKLHIDERWKGISDAFEFAGLTPPQQVPWNVITHNVKPVEELLEKIKTRPDPKPVMLFIATRNMANEIYILLVSMGLKVPDDVNIITFIKRTENKNRICLDTFDFSHESMASEILNHLD